ncbi:MAG: helix-turn-helix domain-containing protein [Pseudomonadota bacterium]
MKLLTNNETANLIGLKSSTLEVWRWQGKGPAYRKVGRLVRYVEADVIAWLDGQTRTSTSQLPATAFARSPSI